MAVLIYETGPEKGKSVRLDAGHVYTVGRDPKNEVPLSDDLASRAHCKIAGKDNKFFVKDADSKNGTFVNDARVNGVAELSSGDRITLGNTALSFFTETDAGGGIGKQLGGYKLLQRLGRGGMGTVYRALQLSLNREVALKILAPKLSRDPAFVERFLKEARAAGQLNNPHIVQVYDAGKDGALTFYAMEFMPGGTVEDRIVKGGPLALDDALRFVTDAARGLQYAELKKIVHRDIKPDNLMLTELSGVKIADLGIAHATDAAEDVSGGTGGAILGTPHFISPEQARGLALDTRSDLYSLGATFFRMLSGRTLFSGESAEEIVKKQVKEKAPSVRDVKADVPERVAAIVAKLLEKDPAARYQTCAELIGDLESLGAKGASGGKTAAIAAALVVLIGGGVGTWAVLRKKNEAPPPPPVVIEDPDAKQKQAEMEQRLHQTQASLEKEQEATAALSALTVKLSQLPREDQMRELRALAEKFPGTNTAKNAGAQADGIAQAIAADQAAANEHEQAVVNALAAWRTPIAAALEAKDFATAARALVAPPPELLKDESRCSDARAELQTMLAGGVNGAAQQSLNDASRALDAGDFAAANSALDTLEPRLTELAGVAAASTDVGAARLKEQVATLLGSLGETRARSGSLATQAAAARLAGDLKLVCTEFDWNAVFDSVRAHRFAEAAQSAHALRDRVATPEYQTWLDRRLADLDAAQALRAAFVAAASSKSLADSKLKHPERDQTFEIAGLTEDGEGIVLEVSNRGGSARATVKFAQFDTVPRLLDLFNGRFGANAAHELEIVRAALLVHAAQSNATARTIAQQFERWQPEAGWSDADVKAVKDVQWPRLDDPRIVDLLARAENDPAHADEARGLRARVERENEAVQLLARAFGPFQARGELSFGGVVPLVEKLLGEYRDTDLALAVYPMIDRGDRSLQLAGSAP